MRNIIDVHTHLIEKTYQKEGYDYEYLVKQAINSGILCLIDTGCNATHSKQVVKQALKYNYVFAVVGIHPSEAHKIDEELDIAIIDKLAMHDKVVGIGEIGLDYYWNDENICAQKMVFEKQLLIAKKYNIPAVLHIRDKKNVYGAYYDALELLKKHKIKKAMLHCFTANYDIANLYIKQGYYISIPGIVTFKNAQDVQTAVCKIPLKYLLVETDAPYLTPVPFRGKINRPDLIKYTIEKIAELKNLDFNSIVDVTAKNAIRLFNLK